tara:strand:+ start:54 stop:875 length:822 start_codon:yes stop_codon:yes gene_type:complete
MKLPGAEVGKQLQVGAGEAKCLGKGTDAIRGSAYIEGPLQVGDDEAFSEIDGTVMIGPDDNTDTEEHAKRSLYVKGNVKLDGNDLTPNVLNVTGDVYIVGNTEQVGDTKQTGNITAELHTITASKFIGNVDGCTGKSSGAKPFDMPHPTKEGHRLRHVCIEGPETAVYVRGRVCNGKNIIDLPEYWDGLVDYETVTIQLTAIGSHQDVIVKRISPIERKIYLQCQGGMPVDCFYHIMAERKDIEKLIPEYEGTSPGDYPGDNSKYNIAGYNHG